MQYVHPCIDFISPAEHINTFHSSLSARLLIFVSNASVVFSSLTKAYFCFCIFSREEKVFWGVFFPKTASLTFYLGRWFFLLISLIFIPQLLSTDTLFCLHFSFSAAWSSAVSQRHSKSVHGYLIFNYFDLISESESHFSIEDISPYSIMSVWELTNAFKCS